MLLSLSDNVVLFSEVPNQQSKSKPRPKRHEAYGFLEIFCGQAWVSRVMRAAGYPTANFDILMGHATPEGKQNCYDLLSDAGFLFLGSSLVLVSGARSNPHMLCELV